MMDDTALGECAAAELQAGDAAWGEILMLNSTG